jgi:hypothetical protein
METRQEKREKKQLNKRTKMLQHGKSLASVYKNVVLRKMS